MTGLVFVDNLRLTLPQSSALAIHLIFCLTAYACHARSFAWLLTTQTLLTVAFWRTTVTIDTELLLASCQYLHQWKWTAFLTTFAHRNYVKFQPPFVTFWLSRYPVLWVWQIAQGFITVSLFTMALRLFGKRAWLWYATPLFALLSTQPGNDLMVLLPLLLARQATINNKRRQAAIWYGLSWLVKPTGIVLFPWFIWWLQGWIVVSVGIVGGYQWWAQQDFWGVLQWRFLLHQLMIRPMFVTPKMQAQPGSVWRVVGTLLWRLRKLGQASSVAAWWYLCPAWVSSVGMTVAWAGIVAGYGNIKYLALLLILERYGERPASAAGKCGRNRTLTSGNQFFRPPFHGLLQADCSLSIVFYKTAFTASRTTEPKRFLLPLYF